MFLKTWNIETRETVGEATADSLWNYPKSPAIINCIFFFFHGLQDLSFPTRDWTWVHGNEITRVLTTGLPANSLFFYSKKIAWIPSKWKTPWMEEPGRLQSMGSLRVGHDWATSLSLFTFMHWRSKWQPTPVFLPGESQGRGSLVGCRLWGRTESDTTEVTQQQPLF